MHKFCLFGALLGAAGLTACGSGDQAGKLALEGADGVSHEAQADASAASVLAATPVLGSFDAGPIQRKVNPRLVSPEPMRVSLPPLSAEKTQAQLPAMGEALQVGLGRELAQTSSKSLLQQLSWQPAANGAQVGAVRITSAGAKGLRLGVLLDAVPGSARFRVHAFNNPEGAVETSAHEVLQRLAKNAQAGDLSDAGRTWWTPQVQGDDVVLEVELPRGVSPQSVQLSIPRLSHVYLDDWAEALLNDAAKNGRSDACNIDAVCRSEVNELANAVARMRFVAPNGNSALCSGTMLNDQDASTFKPYFISANHCISTQTSASTLETDWFYRSPSCNAASTGGGVRTLSGGANLLYNNPDYDTTLLLLNDAPIGGMMFAAWTAGEQAISTDSIGLHHPSGDWLKFSSGRITGLGSCLDTASGMSCSDRPNATTGLFTHYAVQWSQGTTEGGSSGSGVFNAKGQFFGVLHGGAASCSNPSGLDQYGRFDQAFADGLKNWLSNASSSARSEVYRFYNAKSGAHFYSGSAAERDFVIGQLPDFQYEGVAFYAAAKAGGGLDPVFRFYNNRTGAHFYSISAPERDFVISRLPEFAYEGPSWYAQANAGGGSTPVFRFYNAKSGAHFYTSNAAERDFVISRLPDFQYESVAYHVWTAP